MYFLNDIFPYKKIPVLLYHRVSNTPPGNSVANITVLPEVLDSQMKHLYEQGYTTTSLDELAGGTHTEYAENKFLITFDDGYLDNYTTAYPILKKYGFTAVFFLVTGFVGKQHAWDTGTPFPYMTWGQAREMLKDGFSFGSHTCNHPDLTTLGIQNLTRELSVSKDILQQKLGQEIAHFSYPFGRHNALVKECVKQSGYRSACSVSASDSDIFSIERFMITMNDGKLMFLIKSSAWSSWTRSVRRTIRSIYG